MPQFRQFYKTLRYVFDYEQGLYEQLSESERESLTTNIVKAIGDIESNQVLARGTPSVLTDNEIVEEVVGQKN